VEPTVRLAFPEEAGLVVALWTEAGAAPSATDSVEWVAALAARRDAWVLLAEVEGQVVGTLFVTFDGWRGHFYRLAVFPKFRRRGIALQLVREGERLLRDAGASRVAAIVLDDREEAVAFWSAAGFAHQIEATRFTKLLRK
jgi:ribosomal protein S18 acetylase RimI-like enzyme